MRQWAFATSPSPMGLGLTARRFWGSTPREYDILVEVWEMSRDFQASMFFQIRADIHNGWMPRESGAPWTIEDFDGKPRDPRERRMTKDRARSYMKARFRKKGDKSALDGLVGQPLPIPIDRKRG